MDSTRRIWVIATGTCACIGGVGSAVPLIEWMEPTEEAKTNAGPVTVDVGQLQLGQHLVLLWRGQPIWIVHRTSAMLASLKITQNQVADPDSRNTDYPTPEWARNPWRSIRPEYLVFIDICTHLGCAPIARFIPGAQPGLPDDWPGGFLCPCHGSRYDMAARVFKDMPAPANMMIPPYTFLSDTTILLGEHRG